MAALFVSGVIIYLIGSAMEKFERRRHRKPKLPLAPGDPGYWTDFR